MSIVLIPINLLFLFLETFILLLDLLSVVSFQQFDHRALTHRFSSNDVEMYNSGKH